MDGKPTFILPKPGLLAVALTLLLPASPVEGSWLGRVLPGAGPVYEPSNVHVSATVLSADLRRVVVLPLASADESLNLTEARSALAPVLIAELIKTKRFEVARIEAGVLREKTGRGTWTSEEALPSDFLETLREATGCDAVLFAQVTTFKPYGSPVLGWRLKLVDVRTKQTLWAVDEVIDASDPAVAKGARRFDRQHPRVGTAPADGWSVLNSPRRFGEYTLAALLATLPAR